MQIRLNRGLQMKRCISEFNWRPVYRIDLGIDRSKDRFLQAFSELKTGIGKVQASVEALNKSKSAAAGIVGLAVVAAPVIVLLMVHIWSGG